MKEFIYNHYNLLVEKIYGNYFYIKDEKIKIVKIKDLDKIIPKIDISNYLFMKRINVNTFILNNENKYYTKKNNEFILLEKINERDNYIDINYLKKFNNVNSNIEEKDFIIDSEEEIDFYEENINRLGKNNKCILDVFDYYIGLAENSIALYKEIDHINKENIGHKLNIYQFEKEMLNDPINFVKTDRVYNISNYIKKLFIEDSINYVILEKILDEIKKDEEEVLFAYMLYPNYYFDLLKNDVSIECITKLKRNIEKYEKLLGYIKEKYKKNKKIQLFVWLK